MSVKTGKALLSAMNAKLLVLSALLLAPLALPMTSADSASVSVAMDAHAYSIVDVAGGHSPTATVTVLDATGAPAAGVVVRVAFIRQVQLVGFTGNDTVLATTDASGIATASAPTTSSVPGTYFVAAFALGASGSDRYTVGA